MGARTPEPLSGSRSDSFSVRSGRHYRIEVTGKRLGNYVLLKKKELGPSEGSGLSWCPTSRTIFMVRNQWDKVTIIELDRKGHKLRKIVGYGFSDVEDLVYVGEGPGGSRFLLVEERRWNVCLVELAADTTELSYDETPRWNFSGGEEAENAGLESVAFDPTTSTLFLGQEAPPRIFSVPWTPDGPQYDYFEIKKRVGDPSHPKAKNRPEDVKKVQERLKKLVPEVARDLTPGEADDATVEAIREVQRRRGKESPSGIVKPGKGTHRALMGIRDLTETVIDALDKPLKTDMSAMMWHDGHLLLLSDESKVVIEARLTGGESSRLSLKKSKHTGLDAGVPKAEGLTADHKGRLYICSDGVSSTGFYTFKPRAD